MANLIVRVGSCSAKGRRAMPGSAASAMARQYSASSFLVTPGHNSRSGLVRVTPATDTKR